MKRKKLIKTIIKKSFKGAGKNHKNIIEPQRLELNKLKKEQLETILILIRLKERVIIFKSVKEADDDELCEVNEHFSNKLDW